MTTMQNHQRNLVDGPSKEGLFKALSDGSKVSFTDERGMKYKATIRMIEAEDGSRESWNIKGGCSLEPRGMPPGCGSNEATHEFIGWFRTDKRKGHIVLKLV